MSRYNYSDQYMRILTDERFHAGTAYQPTRANILRALHWLIDGARPGDRLFVHYSGHGGQTINMDGTERTGFDGTIYPVDHARNGMIVDDELHAVLVKRLPAGVRLTAFFDCCHSGTMLDLPVRYAHHRVYVDPMEEVPHQLVDGTTPPFRFFRRIATAAGAWMSLGKGGAGAGRFLRMRKRALPPATVVCYSGCRDEQESTDVCILGMTIRSVVCATCVCVLFA